MALITCPECNKEVSTFAKSCPNCGYPISDKCVSPDEYEHMIEERFTVVLTKISNKIFDVFSALNEVGISSGDEQANIIKNIPSVIKTNLTDDEAKDICNIFTKYGLETKAVSDKEELNQYWPNTKISHVNKFQPYAVALLSTNGRECNTGLAFGEITPIPIKEEIEIIKNIPSIIKANLTKEEAQNIYDVFARRKLSVKIIDTQEELGNL